MQTITPPLQQTDQGKEVKNLHLVLVFLIQKLNDPGLNTRFNEVSFEDDYNADVVNELYGSATTKLVFFLQEYLQEHEFKMGVVDNPTAQKFNELLYEFGGLQVSEQVGYAVNVVDYNKTYTISGKVAPAGIHFTVAAFNKNLRSETELGKTTTNDSGAFSISYKPVFRKSEYKTADIFFRIYDGRIEIKDFAVSQVINNVNNILQNGILFNAGEIFEVNIRLNEQKINETLSEFETINALIQPLLEGIAIEAVNENEEHKDFSFLSGETGFDKDKIIRFALSHRLSGQSEIDAEFWYAVSSGSFYADLSKTFQDENLDSNLPKIITALFGVTATAVNDTCKLAFSSNLISSKLEDQLPKWIKQFTAFIIQRTVQSTLDDTSPYVKLLMNSAGLTKEKQEKFLSIYFNHGSFDEAFWNEVLRNKGLEEKEVKKLQFAHSLTTLGENNKKLVSLSASMPGINSMRELALKHNTSSLAQLLTDDMLPENVEGTNPKEKMYNYAITLQRHLFTTQTSAVLQRMAIDKELPIKDDQISKSIAGFFDNQPDFNIRTTSIYNALKTKDAFNGIAEKYQGEVIGHLKTLQRVQAISPTHESVATLMISNIHTAHQVTEMSENSFMTALSEKMGEDVARQVYTNAANLKIRNEHALVSMKEVVQGSGIALIDGNGTMEDRRTAFNSKAAEKNIPVNWESLFGNVDFCECGECTSVYSPAAYFVELLQYLRNNDLDPAASGVQAIKTDPKDISGTVLEKLFRRRPDLGCLELTCVNTNTILPYVDLVNEVMESFVVHLNDYSKNGLIPKQATIEAWNVEDETSDELLAQPQHVNNDAYLELKKAVYPFTLPYDRPVDMIRIFLQYLDTSRYELMKTFRAVEQTSISIDAMPEDTKLPVSPSPDPDESKIPAFNKSLSDRAIDAEFLNITQEEYVILTKEAFLTKDYFNLRTPGITDGQYQAQIGVKEVPEYYGYTGKTGKADMLSTDEGLQTGLTFVKKQFLKRTGLLYVDLVELLKTESLNPLYPKGKALVILESIPFSYRFLQSLVDTGIPDPEIRFQKLIDALVNPQKYITGYDYRDDFDPCKPRRRTKPAFLTANIKQWAFCYFERIGQMIVLENVMESCACVEGQFMQFNGSDIIQVGNMEGQLFLNAGCDLILKRNGKLVVDGKVGHVDSISGHITLTDQDGAPIDGSVLNGLVFDGNKGELGVTTSGKLIDERADKPFGCKQQLADNCDLERVRLKHLDGSDLGVTEYDKIQLFIRLWRKMGWTINETDKALVGLTNDKTVFTKGFKDACDPEVDPKGFAEITPNFLHQTAAVKKLLDKTGLELIKLLTFWTDISTTGEKSLYQRLFLSHNLLTIDNVFKADVNGNYLTKVEKIVDHIPVLMATFHVKYEEIDALLSAADLLTLSNVSRLYRFTVLAKLLHVKTADLKDAFVLFNSDPFKNADEAVAFFDKWDMMDEAGLTFAQLNYVVQDNDNPEKPLKPSIKDVINLTKTIYDGLNAIDDAHPDLGLSNALIVKLLQEATTAVAKKELLQKIATEELARSNVSLLYDQVSVESVMGLLQGSNVYSAAVPVPVKLVSSVDEFTGKFPNGTAAEMKASALLIPKLKYDFTNGILQVTGILSANEKITAKGLFAANKIWNDALDKISDQAQNKFDDLLATVFQNDLANATKTILGGDVKDPDNSDNDTAPVKREYFLEIFLPFLRDKLKEAFLTDILAGAVGMESDTTAALITGILKGVSTKPLLTILKNTNQLVTGTGWKGYLVPLADDDYLFEVKDSKKPFSVLLDSKNILDEKFTLTKELFTSVSQKLKAGQPYLLEISGLTSDLADLNWSTAVLPKSPLTREVLLPIGAVDAVEEGFVKLFKTAIILNAFLLTANELIWLQEKGVNFDKLDFNAISLQHVIRIAAFADLRNGLPASDLTLIDFFKWGDTAAPATIPSAQIALLLARKKEEVDTLIAQPHFNLLAPNDFSNEINLLKLLDAFFVYDKINMKIDLLFDWAKPISQFGICQTIAETIRKSIQARYKQEDWEQVIKPLNDQLREHQKWALINYLLVKPDLIDWGVVDADSLFEFFLIDVQMDACMQTSRLKQAISSVQLFVQRCFLGEEESRGVPNNVLNRERWKWMSRNPLWVANRKVFLYPENWIEGRLRDDKSSFYKELESELLQKDIQPQNVRDALQSYLYKVDEVANMEVVGLYIEMVIDTKGSETNIPFKVHVFGRTRNLSPGFYYRYFNVSEGNWYAWEKIQVDIPSYDVSNFSLNIEISNAVFSKLSGTQSLITFNGVINGFPASMKNFVGKFAIDNTVTLSNIETAPDNFGILRNIVFSIDHLNCKVNGTIHGINTTTINFSGFFDGELIRKSNTNGCYLTPVVWNNRLLIFFPQIKKNIKTAADGGNNKQGSFSKPVEYYEIKMAWSEYRNGKWTQKQVSKDVLNTTPRNGLHEIEYFKFVPGVLKDRVVINIDDNLDSDAGYSGAFKFDGACLQLDNGISTPDMPINYFNKTEPLSTEIGSTIYSWQISNNKRSNSSIYFENAASKEMVRGVAPASNFFNPYTPDLLGRINLEDLDQFFKYNLTIADKADAFGGNSISIYDELKRPYSLYNWETFFHTPFQIANELSANQHFEEAMKWYHYIFDPTAPGTDPKRCWKFLPFKEIDTTNILDNLFDSLQPNTPDQKISQWRDKPFQPHVIARGRPAAYMKNVVMKYIDNLLAWGDYLFRQDTLETVNYATQLYVLAAHLSPAIERIPKQGKIKPQTYISLLNKWDAFGNAMVELELLAPFSQQTTQSFGTLGSGADVATANLFGFASSLYFCIPNNPKLQGYRDLIADRLYKIRYCENIDGVFRMLPLWDPPIDPALLVAATAQGLSLDSVLNDVNSALPNYRFIYLLQKAIDLCNEVKSLGNQLLSVFEKGDAEAMSVMRAGHETAMNNLVMEVKKMQVEEANSALEGLQQNRRTTEYRLRHYLQMMGEDLAKIPEAGAAFSELADPVMMTFVESGLKLIADEKEEMDKAALAHDMQLLVSIPEALSGILYLLPDELAFDFIGFLKQGGTHLGPAAKAAAKVLEVASSVFAFDSASAQRKAGFRRQLQDRILQANLAGYECMQIDKQITSQQIRISISNQEINNQQKMIDHAAEMEAFIKNKYTNEELYIWMKGQLKTVYRQVYDLAFDLAKKAERAFCFERGLTNTMFFQGGYWDASHDGLLSGEKLFLGLKKLEAAYHENRGHDFEVVKPISLQLLNPLALIELRETGKCEFNVPEILFDMDFPGHYMRRIKSIALSIPCIAGPYTSVNASLRLRKHSYRKSSLATSKDDYPRKTDGDDERFLSAVIPIDSIATSTGQRDTGVFELNFKDERYMPFEGAGTISEWQLELPSFRQFKYETISDIIIHMNYTSKEGGDKLKKPAHEALLKYIKDVEELSRREGLFAMFDIKNDFPNEWYKALLTPLVAGSSGRIMELGNLKDRLPFYTKNANGKGITGKDVYLVIDKSFKITDVEIVHSKKVLTGMGGPEKIGNDLLLHRLSDLSLSMNNPTDLWSLKFANNTTEPQRMWMVVRYEIQ